MKISFILIAALIFNTSLLFAEPLSELVRGINPWFLAALEALLLAVYFINRWVTNLTRDFMLDLGYLDVFVVNGPKK